MFLTNNAKGETKKLLTRHRQLSAQYQIVNCSLILQCRRLRQSGHHQLWNKKAGQKATLYAWCDDLHV